MVRLTAVIEVEVATIGVDGLVGGTQVTGVGERVLGIAGEPM